MKMKRGAKVVDALVSVLCWCVILCVRLGVSHSNTTVVKVGVVVDVSLPAGSIGLSCINFSLSDFYASHSHYKTRLLLHLRDPGSDLITAASQVADLIKTEEVQAIIGPSTSTEANFVISLGERAHVPIVTFSATSASLASLQSPYFFRIAQVDSAQANAIVAIVEAFEWKQAVPIYIDNNDYGTGLIPFLTNALQQVYVRIPYLCRISPLATIDAIRGELYKLMTMQTRVFIVHVSPDLGSTLFPIAQQIGMMTEGYVWIVTDGLANVLSSLDSSVMDSMRGVLGVRTYIPETKELDDFKVRWRRKFLQDNPTEVDTHLNVFGLWAYDATTALAMAVEKVGITKHGFLKSNIQNLGVSMNGEMLREALSNTKFQGLSGEFTIVDGQLKASMFEIINVIGSGKRRIGYWTSWNGLAGSLDSSSYKLASIVWPGDQNFVPKGWAIPTHGKKMMVGVPVKIEYTKFVKVTRDLVTNRIEVTGFCIDFFRAVLEELPYALPYKFIPFAKPNGEKAGTYNELINQVYLKNLDAVVGDITITANRSKYVDFTLPYTESGVTMVVPTKDNRKKNVWVFLKPLTWDLWVTTACSFVFIGFVVWVFEHRINEHFQGPLSHQIGTSLWFSFSTIVFAQRERVTSNWSRFVVIIWFFVVLILVQSYTASLITLLTVEQLSPTIREVNLLIKNRMNVGYKRGSFIHEILKEMGFLDSQLKAYNSTKECVELFERGSANGGIAAAFDEVPYVKLFLQSYCSKYTMVEPTIKTGGFSFVFPKGSPLVAEISRAILNVTQGYKMKAIENAWFKEKSCYGSDASVSSNSLGLESFWGLFLIVGVASGLALIFFAINFLYQHEHIWLHYDPGTSRWKRIEGLIRMYYQKDQSSHTFKKREMQDKSGTRCLHDIVEVEASPTT
ncbi:glutamate receptor 2.7-like [Prosopis cineraria]|uniref:glutamate receptor 2.7-like n=1 Tax=Prosopis cineraria TaxID=364024 RepID=UPI00241032B6|nr:glutamate receptor 2.7-like [Prosopis cineraria]